MSIEWVFDIGSLMVLVGEAEEQRFRSSRRTFVEAFVAAPVAGIQNYLKSFQDVSGTTNLEYFSPYGRKRAPLRNIALWNIIRVKQLLHDGKFTTFDIKPKSKHDDHSKEMMLPVGIWAALTWLCFGGLMVLCRRVEEPTWIGVSNCVVLTAWSILIRVIELCMIKKKEDGKETQGAEKKDQNCREPKDDVEDNGGKNSEPPPQRPVVNDGVFILGTDSSGIVISGSRSDIKEWTTSRLDYDKNTLLHIRNWYWQAMIRVGTILVLVLIFSTIPNGSTIDQVAFVLLNIMGQINVFLGLQLNVNACLRGRFIKTTVNETSVNKEKRVTNRTQVYGYLIRYFKDAKVDSKWIRISKILPQTKVWEEWEEEILGGREGDPKDIYDEIDARHKKSVEGTASTTRAQTA